MIDLLVHDECSDGVILTMVERRPWNGTEEQLFQLQEKFNAYLSFALDGEMAESYPDLVQKPLTISLECLSEPTGGAAKLLEMIGEQMALQEIGLEIVIAAPEPTDAESAASAALC